MREPDMKSRLSQLGAHIDNAEARLKLKGLFSAEHQATAEELKHRYAALSMRVHDEIAETEARGHHVGLLEASVRQWLDSLELEID